MREELLLQTGHKHVAELKPLCRVDRHEPHSFVLCPFLFLRLFCREKRRVGEERFQRIARKERIVAARNTHQLSQVLKPLHSLLSSPLKFPLPAALGQDEFERLRKRAYL